MFFLHKKLFYKITDRLLQSETVCIETHCIKTSAKIIDFIDPSIDPCHNFDQFACGNFIKNPNRHQQIKELNAIITGNGTFEDPETVKLQRKFYKSCLHTKSNDTNILKLLENIGGWPVLKDRLWNELEFNWMNSVSALRKLGLKYDHFFKFSTTEEENTFILMVINRNNSLYYLNFQIEPPRSFNLDKNLEEIYIKLMLDIGITFGAKNSYQVKNEFIRVLQFQSELDLVMNDFTHGCL